MVPARDGIGLATDLYFPATGGRRSDGKFPVVLVRTPYDKTAPGAVLDARYLARRGYVCAMQDVRGRFASEGEWYAFAKEAPDGYDAVEWLGTQPWSTGRVGTMGDSYAGSDQAALATLDPPHLSTMIVAVGASNYYHSSMRQNGALEQRFLVYVFRMAATSKEAEADAGLKAEIVRTYTTSMNEIIEQFPLREGATILRRLPSYERWAIDIQTHGDYDDYWKQRGYAMSEYYDEHADVPTLYLGGWYDSYAPQHLRVLRRPEPRQVVPTAPVDGPVDPWPVRDTPLGRPILRHRRPDHVHGPEAGVVRPAPQGPPHRDLGLAAGEDLHDGEGERRQGRPGSARRRFRVPRPRPSRRLLAQRARLAAARHGLHPVLPPRRRLAVSRRALGGGVRRDDLHVRPHGPRAHAGWRHLRRRHGHGPRRVRPAGPPRRHRLPRRPAPERPARRAHLPDRRAGPRHRGDRAHRDAPLGLLVGPRYRLHREAHRRLPAERQLPRRPRLQHHRLDNPRPVPQRLGQPRGPGAGQALRARLPALPHVQRIPQGPPHPARR